MKSSLSTSHSPTVSRWLINLLVNPAHPHAAQLRVTKLRRWLYDPRALRLPA